MQKLILQIQLRNQMLYIYIRFSLFTSNLGIWTDAVTKITWATQPLNVPNQININH